MTSFKQLCAELEIKIQESYTSGTSLEDAEKLAAEFLHAQLRVSEELKKEDLNARMRKVGVKAVRAAVYLDVLSKNDKKPTEAGITAIIDTTEIVRVEQEELDKAEVNRDELTRYYDIFLNAHIFYRGVAKGSFGG